LIPARRRQWEQRAGTYAHTPRLRWHQTTMTAARLSGLQLK